MLLDALERPSPSCRCGSRIQRPPHPPRDPRPVFPRKIALPHPQHPPARLPQKPTDFAIPRFVSRQLGRPPLRPRFGKRRVFWLGTSVPKTAINKKCDALTTEDEVWLPGQLLIPPPAGNPGRTEEVDHPQFGRLVSVSANPRHDGATLLAGEDIRHGSISTVLFGHCCVLRRVASALSSVIVRCLKPSSRISYSTPVTPPGNPPANDSTVSRGKSSQTA